MKEKTGQRIPVGDPMQFQDESTPVRQKVSKNEKRSSSQPTVIPKNSDIAQQSAKFLPKHFVEEKKQMYYQNRRLSDDPNLSRQGTDVRYSEKSKNNSRATLTHDKKEKTSSAV